MALGMSNISWLQTVKEYEKCKSYGSGCRSRSIASDFCVKDVELMSRLVCLADKGHNSQESSSASGSGCLARIIGDTAGTKVLGVLVEGILVVAESVLGILVAEVAVVVMLLLLLLATVLLRTLALAAVLLDALLSVRLEEELMVAVPLADFAPVWAE